MGCWVGGFCFTKTFLCFESPVVSCKLLDQIAKRSLNSTQSKTEVSLIPTFFNYFFTIYVCFCFCNYFFNFFNFMISISMIIQQFVSQIHKFIAKLSSVNFNFKLEAEIALVSIDPASHPPTHPHPPPPTRESLFTCLFQAQLQLQLSSQIAKLSSSSSSSQVQL